MGIYPEDYQESRHNLSAWDGYICSRVRYAQEHICPSGMFLDSLIYDPSPLTRHYLGPRQRRAARWLLGHSGGVYRSHYHQPAHDLPSVQELAQALAQQRSGFIIEEDVPLQRAVRVPFARRRQHNERARRPWWDLERESHNRQPDVER